jgi:ribonuclease J
VIGLFASNVHRLNLLGGIAERTGRRLVPLGRSVRTHTRVASETGYLPWDVDGLVPPEAAAALPRERVLGIATGTQAEGNAALARIARGDHALSLEPGDTVIFSSRIIPGHEPEVSALTSELLRRGLRVITRLDEPEAHVSGHAARPEQARMINATRPRAFIPLHGTLHHLTRHAALARSLGVSNTCVLENGDVAELAGGVLSRVGRLPAGRVHVAFGHPIAPEVLRERVHIAAGGFVVAVARLDSQGRIVGAIDLRSRGVLGEASRGSVGAEVEREARAAVEALSSRQRAEDAAVADVIRLTVRRALVRATGYRPDVDVAVVRVADLEPVV